MRFLFLVTKSPLSSAPLSAALASYCQLGRRASVAKTAATSWAAGPQPGRATKTEDPSCSWQGRQHFLRITRLADLVSVIPFRMKRVVESACVTMHVFYPTQQFLEIVVTSVNQDMCIHRGYFCSATVSATNLFLTKIYAPMSVGRVFVIQRKVFSCTHSGCFPNHLRSRDGRTQKVSSLRNQLAGILEVAETPRWRGWPKSMTLHCDGATAAGRLHKFPSLSSAEPSLGMPPRSLPCERSSTSGLRRQVFLRTPPLHLAGQRFVSTVSCRVSTFVITCPRPLPPPGCGVSSAYASFAQSRNANEEDCQRP